MNNPINGNRKVAMGAIDQLMFGSSTTSCVSGSASNTMAAMPITHTFSTGYQFSLRINTPADRRPIARQAAKMLVTCTLMASGSFRISLLNVGSQVPTLCSTNTYKNAVMTNTHTSGLKNSLSIAAKSCDAAVGGQRGHVFVEWCRQQQREGGRAQHRQHPVDLQPALRLRMGRVDEVAEHPVGAQHAEHEKPFEHIHEAGVLLAVGRDQSQRRIHRHLHQRERHTDAEE